MAQFVDFASTMLMERGSVLLIIAVVFSATLLYPRLQKNKKVENVPLVGKEIGGFSARRKAFLQDPMRFYLEGYKRFKGRAFRVTHYEGERIVLPGSALDELWNISEAILNKNKAYDRVRLWRY